MSEYEFPLQVRQNVLEAYGEYQNVAGAGLKMGVPVQASVWDLFALQGRMFNLHEATIGTVITAQAVDAGGLLLTAPTIRVGVPSGYTFFPYSLQIALETAAGTLNEVAVVVSDTSSYTSGGTSATARNWRNDSAARATAAVNVYYCSGSAIVEAALTSPKLIFTYVRPAAFTAGETFDGGIRCTWPVLRPIVGPASLLVYVGAATTASTYSFALDWAEIPTTSAIQA